MEKFKMHLTPGYFKDREELLRILQANGVTFKNTLQKARFESGEEADIYVTGKVLHCIGFDAEFFDSLSVINELSISEFMEMYGGAQKGAIQFDEKQFTEMLCGS